MNLWRFICLQLTALNRPCRRLDLRVIEEDILLKLWFFWTFWGIDALICIIVFFLLGLADGSVSSFNIGIWIAIGAALTVIIVGSLWLKVVGYPVFGTMLLLVLAIPGILYGLFLFLTIVTKTQWN
jgi:hypothetical protein